MFLNCVNILAFFYFCDLERSGVTVEEDSSSIPSSVLVVLVSKNIDM